MEVSAFPGKQAEASMLVNVPRLITAYYTDIPDPSVPEQRVSFGTSGHRGSAFKRDFNEWHILAISQAICLYRRQKKIDGPLFLGMDTHALSVPALASALEVLAANGVGRDPGVIYRELTREFGESAYDRVEASATPEQKQLLERLTPQHVRLKDLAGEKIQTVLTLAPGNGAPLGGVKVATESGWFAVRPSGTENINKIYGESFQGSDHLRRIMEEAQTIVSDALTAVS